MCYNIGVREYFLFLHPSLAARAKGKGLGTIRFQTRGFVSFAPALRLLLQTHRTSKSEERPGYIYENNDSFETSYH